jgi:hypothetical protein
LAQAVYLPVFPKAIGQGFVVDFYLLHFFTSSYNLRIAEEKGTTKGGLIAY